MNEKQIMKMFNYIADKIDNELKKVDELLQLDEDKQFIDTTFRRKIIRKLVQVNN